LVIEEASALEQLDDEFALALHHLHVFLARPVAIRRGDSPGDGGQAGSLHVSRTGHQREEVPGHEPRHRSQEHRDSGGGCGVDDRGVERQDEPLELDGIVARRDEPGEVAEALAQPGLVAGRGAAYREPVDEREEVVVVSDRGFVEGVDERAAVQLDGDPALTFERDERLSDRDAAQSERVGNLVLGDAITGAEPAVEDEAPDVERGMLAAAAPDEGLGAEAGPRVPGRCRLRFDDCI